MKNGKHVKKDLRIRWYCCNCWEAGITNVRMNVNDKPTRDEMYSIVRLTHHPKCTQPDIRLVS